MIFLSYLEFVAFDSICVLQIWLKLYNHPCLRCRDVALWERDTATSRHCYNATSRQRDIMMSDLCHLALSRLRDVAVSRCENATTRHRHMLAQISHHRYLACMILVTSPFNWHHALTFDLLHGQSCCRVGTTILWICLFNSSNSCWSAMEHQNDINSID